MAACSSSETEGGKRRAGIIICTVIDRLNSAVNYLTQLIGSTKMQLVHRLFELAVYRLS